jgi:hypothetical protein
LATARYRDLKRVCEKLGLQAKKIKSGIIYVGNCNGVFSRIVIHLHVEGRDIPDGLFNRYVKNLGFTSEKDFFNYLKD